MYVGRVHMDMYVHVHTVVMYDMLHMYLKD